MDYNEDVIIKVEDIKKEYRLGAIGGTTLKEELQRIGARLKKIRLPKLMEIQVLQKISSGH